VSTGVSSFVASYRGQKADEQTSGVLGIEFLLLLKTPPGRACLKLVFVVPESAPTKR